MTILTTKEKSATVRGQQKGRAHMHGRFEEKIKGQTESGWDEGIQGILGWGTVTMTTSSHLKLKVKI